MDRAPDPNDADARLKVLRASRDSCDVIDRLSNLNADDIDAILSFGGDFPLND